jgi:AcrR family transcriptional regulator
MNTKATTARRTQEERRKESRRKVIDAATRLIGTRGYSGTTLVEIGREAGVSHGLVTYHFGTKEDCIKAVLEDIRAATTRRNEGRMSGQRGLASLDRLCEFYLRGSGGDRPGARAIYVAIAESIGATPELKDLTAQNDDVFRQTVARALTEALEDGEISAEVDVSAYAVLIVGLLRGVSLQRMVNPRAVKLDAMVPALISMVRASLPVVEPETDRSGYGNRNRNRNRRTS